MTMPDATIRPFEVHVPNEDLADLQRRIAATRRPSKEVVGDRSQLAHVRGGTKRPTAVQDRDRWVRHPLHPRQVAPRERVAADHHARLARFGHRAARGRRLLTDPAAHGGRAEDAFHLVLPSLPGYGFSDEPTSVGWDPDRTARAWAELMHRLGYIRYVAQGSDVGAAVTDTMAIQAPDGLAGIHLNFLRRPPLDVTAALFGGAPVPPGLTEMERAAFDAFRAQFMKGYIAEQGQSPQTIGYALTDSPAGLAAWMRPRHRQLREDLPRLCPRAALRRPDTGQDPRQHRAVLADQHRDLGRVDVLGERAKRRCRGRAAAA
jgi:pimeloyl-ACP methyl ester carboxylesterase